MSKPTVHAFALLELLQSYSQFSGNELARRPEVGGRTLRRYTAALEELGIPISTRRGRHGGHHLVADFKLPPLTSSAEETLAASLGLLVVCSLGLGESELAPENVQTKLNRMTPDTLWRHLVMLRETASLGLAHAWAETSVVALTTLTETAQVRARAEFCHHDPQGAETFRQLDLCDLVYCNGYWYANGFCHLRQALHSFRPDRLDTLRMLAKRLERPVDLDTPRRLRESFAWTPCACPVEILMRAAREQVVAVLDEPLGLLAEVDGGTPLRASTDDLDWSVRHLCGLPFDSEIRQPLELCGPLGRRTERVLRSLDQGEASDHRQVFRGRVLLVARLPLSRIGSGQPTRFQEVTGMPAVPLCAMVLYAGPDRLFRYGAPLSHYGYLHLGLYLDRWGLRCSLDQDYSYDYFLYDGFHPDQGCKGTLVTLGRSGSIRCFLPVGGSGCYEKCLLFEWSRGHGLSISAISDRPLGQVALAVLVKRGHGCPDLLRGIV